MDEAFKFSKIAEMGTRVPRQTQAPLTFLGMLSTAGQCDHPKSPYVTFSHSRTCAAPDAS